VAQQSRESQIRDAGGELMAAKAFNFEKYEPPKTVFGNIFESASPVVFSEQPDHPVPLPDESNMDFVKRAFQNSVEEHILYSPITSATPNHAQEMTASTLSSAMSHIGGYVKSIKTSPNMFGDRIIVSADCVIPEVNETTAPTLQSIGGLRNLSVSTDTAVSTDSIYLMGNGITPLTHTTSNEIRVALEIDTTAGGVNVNFDEIYDTMRNFAPTREEKIKRIVKKAIAGNLRIEVNSRSRIGSVTTTPAEEKARQTLRDMISEKEWRRYITNGFLMVRGQSGKFYQIFIDRSHTIVWENNKRIKELCIVTDNKCPPTDHVITIKVMVELDEQSVWDGANKYGPRVPHLTEGKVISQENLVKRVARVA
jgi:hypothetical protein